MDQPITSAELKELSQAGMMTLFLDQQNANIELTTKLAAANRFRDDAEKKAIAESKRADETDDEAVKMFLRIQTLEDTLRAMTPVDEVERLRKELEHTKKERDDTGEYCMHLESELNDLKSVHSRCTPCDKVTKMEQAIAAACNIMGIPLDTNMMDRLIAGGQLHETITKEAEFGLDNRSRGDKKMMAVRSIAGGDRLARDDLVRFCTILSICKK